MLLNASSPIKDFEVRANIVLGGYWRDIRYCGDRLASIAIGLPYVDARRGGLLDGMPERVNRAGVADLRVRLTLSLLPGFCTQRGRLYARAAGSHARREPGRQRSHR